MSQKRTTTVLGVLMALALLVLAACGDAGGDSDEPAAAQQETEQAPDTQEPGLDDVPAVVAEVNGQEVTREEFAPAYQAQLQQAAMQAQMSGQEPDAEAVKQQTATVLVNTVLLRQQAEERGISASADDVEGELTKIAEQNQLGSVDELLAALERQYAAMVDGKQYLTGGLGSRWDGESFGDPHELPNDRAYAETCAAIGGVQWAWRLLLATGDARYADQIERLLLNGFLAGLSLGGTEYFYVNPLQLRTGAHAEEERNPAAGRRPWFGCACCPPNPRNAPWSPRSRHSPPPP